MSIDNSVNLIISSNIIQNNQGGAIRFPYKSNNDSPHIRGGVSYMIEIKTQNDIDKINSLIDNCTTEEIIRIHALENNQAYIIHEPIMIQKDNITIEGYGINKSILKGDTDCTHIIKVLGESTNPRKNITIDNLLLQTTYTYSYGIYCHCTGGGTVPPLNYKYSDTYAGSRDDILKGITIKNCNIYTYMNAILLVSCHNCDIINNSLHAPYHTIQMSNVYSSVVNNNKLDTRLYINGGTQLIITNNYAEIAYLSASYYNILSGNQFSGIQLNRASKNTITDNIIKFKSTRKSTEDFGIQLIDSSNWNVIYDNIILKSLKGIEILDTSSYNTVSANILQDTNLYSIHIEGSSNKNIVSCNSVTDNEDFKPEGTERFSINDPTTHLYHNKVY